MGAGRDVDERMGPDALELLAGPGRALSALVLRVPDLERGRVQGRARRVGREGQLDAFPVALVLVVEVVEVVVEPVLERDPVRDARFRDDGGIGHRGEATEEAAGILLVAAAGVERVAGGVEVDCLSFRYSSEAVGAGVTPAGPTSRTRGLPSRASTATGRQPSPWRSQARSAP